MIKRLTAVSLSCSDQGQVFHTKQTYIYCISSLISCDVTTDMHLLHFKDRQPEIMTYCNFLPRK